MTSRLLMSVNVKTCFDLLLHTHKSCCKKAYTLFRYSFMMKMVNRCFASLVLVFNSSEVSSKYHRLSHFAPKYNLRARIYKGLMRRC